MRNGVYLAIKEWNDKGGINGKKIVSVLQDGQCTAGPAVDAALTLIDEGVHYIVGEVCSKASIPTSALTNAARVIQISPTSTNPMVTIDAAGNVKPYTFRNCFVDPYQGLVAAKFAYFNLGVRTAFVMGDKSNDYVSGIRDAFEAAFQRLGGTIVGSADYTSETTDFSETLSAIKSLGPEMVFLPDYYNIVNLVIKQARQDGISVPFLGGDGCGSQDLDLNAAEGGYFINHFSDKDPRPEVKLFLDQYQRLFSDAEKPVGVLHMIAALAYDATNMLLQSIMEAGTDDSSKVAKILESIHFQGVTGNLTFDALHNPQKSAFIFAVRDASVQFQTRIDP